MAMDGGGTENRGNKLENGNVTYSTVGSPVVHKTQLVIEATSVIIRQKQNYALMTGVAAAM